MQQTLGTRLQLDMRKYVSPVSSSPAPARGASWTRLRQKAAVPVQFVQTIQSEVCNAIGGNGFENIPISWKCSYSEESVVDVALFSLKIQACRTLCGSSDLSKKMDV